jgi:DNA-directed RNA polymerase subunit F
MIGKSIKNQTMITNTEAKAILEDIEKDYIAKDRLQGYELEQSIKYLKKFSKVKNIKDIKEIKTKLNELELPENIIIELINIAPKTPEVIKAILFRRVKSTNEEQLINKILKIFE